MPKNDLFEARIAKVGLVRSEAASDLEIANYEHLEYSYCY